MRKKLMGLLDFLYNNKKNIFSVLYALVLLFFSMQIVPYSLEIIEEAILRIIPNTPELTIFVLVGVVISMLFTLLFIGVLTLFRNIKILEINNWFAFTVNLMIVLAIMGLFIISAWFGITEMGLKLRETTDMSWWGNISCSSAGNSILTGDQVFCSVEPEINIVGSTIEFNFKNGSSTKSNFNNLTFIAPENVDRISILIGGNDANNDTILLSTGHQMTFLTNEEDKERSEKALAFSLALLGIIFFSVPPFVLNIKKLYEGK